jgi:hypothetical protein
LTLDPRSGTEKSESWIRDKHPGSATLAATTVLIISIYGPQWFGSPGAGSGSIKIEIDKKWNKSCSSTAPDIFISTSSGRYGNGNLQHYLLNFFSVSNIDKI